MNMEKEKESDSDNKPSTDLEESHHLSKTGIDETTKEPPLYFTKDGKAQFGITPPTAFALSYPFPPLPSNLAKNRVLRASDEARKESVQEGIDEAEKEFEKEAMPLPSLKLQGSPLPKVLIPEIELALYWDRHPYEFRVPEKGQSAKENGNNTTNNAARMRRSKSDMNLASKVGKLLEEQSIAGNSSRSRSTSVSASNKTIRSSIVTSASSSVKNVSNELLSPKSSHHENHLALVAKSNGLNDISNGNHCNNGKCGSVNSDRKTSANSGRNPSDDKQLRSGSGKLQGSAGTNMPIANKSLQMSESERKKFDDIGLFRHQSEQQSQGQGGHLRRPIRSQDQLENKKSTGVQVTIDDVAAAALKSTYLCPLHGQYRRGVERRDKGGFRTDMSSRNNFHAHCSRALKGKPSKTKMIKTMETQTEDVGSFPFQSVENRTNKRSRTAGHARGAHKARDIMASEYHGSYRDPYKIAESEKRHLRNKILNYCFTKHSIF